MIDNIIDFSNITILYVEDEDKLRENIADMLSDDIKKLYVAKNGDEALTIYKKFDDIDLIISDVQMPRMNGLEMARKIKSINKTVPIIFTTAFTDSEYLMKAIEIGVDKYIKKPVNMSLLYEAIEQVCEPIHQRRQIEMMNETLEKKIIEKTAQLRELNDNLQERVEEEVSENRKKDRILIQQSRFSEMGEMIENIAHQWRQPLNTITLLTSNAQFKHKLGKLGDEEFERTFNKIESLMQYLSQTINDFRSFFQPDRERANFNLEDTISRSLTLTEASFEYNHIKVHKKVEQLNIRYLGFPNELSQVFLNILNNSRDAMIEQNIEEKNVLFCLRQESRKIVIQINDNAGGLPEDIIEKIFDPYFTTKIGTKGTGLGLSMCKEIIEGHMSGTLSAANAHFEVDNKRFFGAQFTIELPLII